MTNKTYDVISVVGNRPQFVKQAMFDAELARAGTSARIRCRTVNTGQHYDDLMSDVFFRELGAAPPAFELGVGSGPILDQIGKMLAPLREIFEAETPDAVLTFGDTNSTIAATLAAAHMGIPCIHVEGGERLYRRRDVPEEVNRVATDHLSDLILTSSRKANRYLAREGMSEDRAIFVGDIMLDLFKSCMRRVDAEAKLGPADYGVVPGEFALATLHRVENTASEAVLTGLLSALDRAPMPVVLPMHPRIAHLLKSWNWAPSGNLKLVEPLGYFDLLALLRDCSLVISDSGGVTREALFAGKPCIVPLDSCWWTEAVQAGLAITVGQDVDALAEALDNFRPDTSQAQAIVETEFGDGESAGRIVSHIVELLDHRHDTGQREGPWHRQGYFNEIPAAEDRTDFTYTAFESMIGSMKSAGYTFAPFAKPEDPDAAVCLLRHDIDFDLGAAVDFARVEADLGVSSTYFIMLTSPHYNPATADSRAQLAQLRALGHNIGLHFDAEAYDDLDAAADYQRRVGEEADRLAQLSGGAVQAVSFHRPTPLILKGEPALTAPYLHSYDRDLNALTSYVSDSNGAWAHGHPLTRDAFAARKPMHILIHPIWWSHAPMSAYERLLTTLDTRTAADELSFAQNCRAFRAGRMGRRFQYND